MRASPVASRTPRLLVAVTLVALAARESRAEQQDAETVPAVQARSPSADGIARPSVLFIAIDDLNDWVGAMGGHPQVRTPNIDRLAARGMLFTRAYCSSPGCNPSRASLLGGERPTTTGVYVNRHIWRAVRPDGVTLPQHFMAHGYHVAGGGKVFHSTFNDPASWHKYFKDPDQVHPATRPSHHIKGFDPMNDWGPVDVSDDRMSDMKVTEWAIRRLREPRDRPLFLAVGFNRPHLPWYAPRKYFDLYPLSSLRMPVVKEGDLDDVPRAGRSFAAPWKYHEKIVNDGQWRKAVQAYLACISFVDACVGRLIEALDAGPRANDTIIVLWGDNGYNLGEKAHWGKFALWEKDTRVPLIIVVPGVTRPGESCERVVSLLDLYPTLIELCGLPPRSELEGTSLVPLLKNPAQPWDRPALMTQGRGNHAVRTERWRYIRYRDGSEELYDHESDPHEWTNLADDPAQEAIKRELAKWLPTTEAKEAPLGPARVPK